MDGDANTHFFYITTISHRRYNHIHNIIDSSNSSITDLDHIGLIFIDYFANLFQSGAHSFPSDLQGLVQPSITADANSTLTNIPSSMEIIQALGSMQGRKSPGLDGMSPLFFKHFWNTIDQDVISAIQSFFRDGIVSQAVNHTFLTLIPKRAAANKVEQF